MFGQEEEERQHQHQQQQQQQQAMVIKGKRTKRLRHASPLTPLVTMSNSSSSHDDTTGMRLATSSSSTITTTQEEEDMAHCLILLAQGGGAKLEPYQPQHQQQSLVGVVYECKTCNRCFPSFQALGGHRASHKKPKMTPQPEPAMDMGLSLQLACNSSNTLRAINFNPNENLPNFKPTENLPNKPKAHPCGICGAEFSSGQALGGHMRRHRPLATNTLTPATPPAINLQLCLDLNLPAEEEDQEAETPKFMFGSNENTLVFTAGALVDCRY